jgi:hypothetical protein
MKTTVSRYDFERAFVDADRKENFSYEGLGLLFDYFEEIEEGTGQEIELDVIAICCEYAEDTWQDLADNHGIEYENDVDGCDAVRDYMHENTSVVGETSSGFVYAIF